MSSPLPKWLRITFIATALVTIVAFLVFFQLEHDVKARWSAVAVGIGSSALVTFFQLIMYADDIRLKARLENLHIVDMIERRGENLEQIAELIESANRRVFVIGGNAHPILTKHATKNLVVGQPTPTILEAAIRRGVQVRILIASRLHQNEYGKRKYGDAVEELNSLESFTVDEQKKSQIGDFKWGEFQHNPTFYLVVADEDVVAGATFPKCRCPAEPAIHFKSVSPIARSHIRHFVDEWEEVTGNADGLAISKSESPIRS
jgi:hypothetical protein